MGAITCCQNEVYREEFRQYCLTVTSPDYKNYFTSIKHEEYKPTTELKTQVKHYKQGSWKKDEKQTGKGVIFAPQQFYYEGQIVDGVAKGEGKIIWPNKNFYKGMIEDNKGQGFGELHFADRNIILKGSWVRGFPRLNQKMELSRQGKHGSITFVDYTGKKQEQFFKDTLTIRIDFGNGVSYEGEVKIKNGVYRIQGKGTMRYPDDSYYDGEFEAGKMHGKGRYTWTKTGNWFEGTYKDNVREGKGTYYYSDTEFESGEWKGGVLVKDQITKPQEIVTPVQHLEAVVQQ